MTRPRTYRHDVRCPDCGSNWMRKDGHIRGKQAYSCGDCARRYQPDASYRRPSATLKAQAIELYTEGSSLSATGRVLGYSATAVQGWVKRGSQRAEALARASGAAGEWCGGTPCGSGGLLR